MIWLTAITSIAAGLIAGFALLSYKEPDPVQTKRQARLDMAQALRELLADKKKLHPKDYIQQEQFLIAKSDPLLEQYSKAPAKVDNKFLMLVLAILVGIFSFIATEANNRISTYNNLNELAYQYILEGNLQQAMPLIIQSEAQDPYDPQLILTKALTKLAMRRFDSALSDFELILETYPNDPRTMLWYGICLKNLGNKEQAIAVLTSIDLNSNLDLNERATAEAALMELQSPE